MRVFDFTHAIVRSPGRSVVNGIRMGRDAPSYEGVATEHAAYARALRALDLAVVVLPPLEDFPDSVFVEDPALVFPEGAILLNPGASSRNGEREEMRHALHAHFDTVLELAGDEFVDGGDVLVTPDVVFVGLSARTTRKGAEALGAKLTALGHTLRVAEVPEGVLHLKSACSLLDNETILATEAMARSDNFPGFRVIMAPAGEDGATNLIRINDTVVVGDRYPQTIGMLREAGFVVMPLAISEIAKLDAGLSCMSLRW